MNDRYDIRNIYPEIEDNITITGDLTKLFDKKQFNILFHKGIIREYGSDGYVSYIKMENLFTLDDVKNKIEEILKDSDEE